MTVTLGPMIKISNVGDTIIGLYNTSAGQSTGGYDGLYASSVELPPQAMDDNVNTKYVNNGINGSFTANLLNPGANTGFFVIPSVSNASLAVAVRFATANDYPNRDPITITLEGSNESNTTALHLGSSWTLIYNGSTGLLPVNARRTYGVQQNFSNTQRFRSYRLLITTQRDLTDCVQYSESVIIGHA